jgi:hypothetical protein
MIDVALVAWPRHLDRMRYFQDTVEKLKKNLHASRHQLNYYCSAESAEVNDVARSWMQTFCNLHEITLKWQKPTPDFGTNMNSALEMGRGDYKFLVLDDWELLQPLDISGYARFLSHASEFGIVRFGWSPRKEVTIFGGTVCRGPHMVEILPESVYPYGDHPHLRRSSYKEEFGPYFEGGNLGKPEVHLGGQLRLRKVRIAATPSRYFGHIGEVSSVEEHWSKETKSEIQWDGTPDETH